MPAINNNPYSARLPLFPATTKIIHIDNQAQLSIAGCNLVQLADQYGTPLYLYDRATLDNDLDSFRQALVKHYPGVSGITYAGKAFLCKGIAQWAGLNGILLDCTGAGEIGIAVHAGLKRESILVHGVNKSAEDLFAALSHAGTIVVDNLLELNRLRKLIRNSSTAHIPLTQVTDHQDDDYRWPSLWLRLRLGLTVDTHAYTQTGHNESKFGLDLDEASRAVQFCQKESLPLEGIHFHLGSQFRDPSPIGTGMDLLLNWVSDVAGSLGWFPKVICPGGGWGVPYHEDDLPRPSIEEYVAYIADRLVSGCKSKGIPLPRLQLEPGRSLVACAGVAIYKVGAIKRTSLRRWLLLDGGLADNPRPALYGTHYSALPVVNPERSPIGLAWLGGPYCESGDILIEDLPMPEIEAGELIAVPASGAYHLSMSSNYNGAYRPAVLWLEDGTAHIIQRRETSEDLVRRDMSLPEK